MTVRAFGAVPHDKPLEPMAITRRAVGTHDVRIDITFCGVCHSDLHQVRAEWAGTVYPCVPGHEIVGRAAATGDAYTFMAPDEIAMVRLIERVTGLAIPRVSVPGFDCGTIAAA